MSETIVSKFISKTIEQVGSANWIKIANTITYHEWSPRLKAIYRKTKRIKRSINIIVTSELSHKNQFFYNLLCVQNMGKVQLLVFMWLELWYQSLVGSVVESKWILVWTKASDVGDSHL